MLHKRLKKRLSSCLAAVLAVTCMFSSIPVQASNTRAADNRVNLALGITYETNATDADYNESYPDFDHVKMTDGQMASSVWSGASVGFKNLKRGDPAADIPLTLTFDLGGEKDVNAVLFSGWDSNNDGGIRNPVHYVIKYWADGAWQVLHEQSHSRVDRMEAMLISNLATPFPIMVPSRLQKLCWKSPMTLRPSWRFWTKYRFSPRQSRAGV